MKIRALTPGALLAALLALSACGARHVDAAATPHARPLSLAAQIGQKAFFDASLSRGKNMSCASCHSPQYAYGPPNSLSVQLGSDPTQLGQRAVPSLRYKDATPAYADNAENPDGVTQAAAGGGLMWDGRAATLAQQAGLPLLNPVEMGATSKAAVVQAVRHGAYADLFTQAFGAAVFDDVDTAFDKLGAAIQAFEAEDISFHPYTSKYDLYVHNKIGGKFTAAEIRGLRLFNNHDAGNCSACHYGGVNFDGNQGLMTDFTYQALGAPRNDRSIPGNPDPIPSNADASWFDMGLCGPFRTDHAPAHPGATDAYCGKFKVPTLRNAATRGAFFHNGVFHSLNQVLHFYNTRDTHPEYWYPASGGTGQPVALPDYALQVSLTPGATVHRFNDLPTAQQGNLDEEVPLGSGITPADNVKATTLGAGVQPRAAGSKASLSEQDIADLLCFLETLSDGYQVPAKAPTHGSCVE